MDTRLDRLLILLDSGSHSAIKRAAAVQLGDIVKLHPEELDNLLNKVFVYFTKKNWDTRIAAGEAVEAIAKNVPLWNPSFNCRNSTSLPKVKGVNVDKFNLTRVMQSASVMVSSVHDNESEQLTSKDIPVSQQIAEQKTALKKVFTIKGAPQDVFGTEELFDDKDLVLHSTEELSGRVYRSPLKIIEQEITAALVVDNFPIAPLKRRADNEVAELPVAKKMHLKVDMEGMEQVVKGDREAIITKDQPQSKWPFAWFCDKLVKELFNVEWEVRQGAAIGLREIIKLHGIRAGYTNEAPIETQKLQNATWLSKLALKLVCVLALDKFGDFASDEVVAPVRETCAQTLGAAIHHMSEDNAKQILHLCLSMQQHSNWEARHGGLLGIKYLLAVKQSIVREVLPSILPSILEALKDHNDDVKAVAADTLVPVTQHLIETFPNKITSILNILWDSVKNLDDLTTSTSSIMTLLSSLSLRAVKAGCLSLQPFHQLVPSLWPPMSHTVASVREAALDTLRTLLESNDIDGEPPAQCSWTPDIINKTLRFLYQRIILESNIKIFDMLLDVWRSFLMHCSLSDLNFSCEKSLNTWLYLLMTRQRQNIEGHVLLPTKESEPTINSFIGGCISADDPTTIENADTRARFGASRALGYLCCHIMKLNSTSLSYRILNEFLMSALNTNSAVNIMCTSLVLYDWASIARKEYNSDLEKCFPRTLTNKLALLLNQEPGIYDELFTMNDSMQTGTKAVAIHLVRAGFRDRIKIPAGEFTIDEAIRLCNFAISEAKSSKEIISKVKALVPVINDLKLMMDRWRTKVESVIAGALIAWGQLTEKFNPIVRPLMDSIKKEDNQLFQMKAANSISLLLEKCINRLPCPNPKIFKNLCSLLCTDPSKTPDVSNFWILQNLLASPVTGKPSTPISPGTASPFDVSFTCNKEAGIITLFNQHKSNQVQIQRIGAERAVTTIARYFGRSLFEKLPFCSNHLMVPLMSPKDALHELDFTKYKEDAASQKIVIALQILEVLAPSIDASLHEKVLRSQYQQILHCAIFPYTAVRHLAARCLAVLATLDLVGVMDMIIKKIIPALGDTERDAFREGSIEVIASIHAFIIDY
ncbi:uncharacterized protein TRIADDRAFT_53613 [Trichoplax adhaerens]|uniref:Mot1 central domain-containing protein n=1 Tax=Trichoplax adhaerens TaxID=10228 RepID=B3RPP5_TRIAD|nr:hypothetical protein TRIADDRAFT_53613 [Trichoplax adhaerens]EDV27672.1 hypothetical protein TRIADDRAFT_53613 [Trichoplax adhaerens]|eukprot:XP_002109506.1 hypothetical protein TRIADDRAFT_53613 [Trichoplax adhaerens]